MMNKYFLLPVSKAVTYAHSPDWHFVSFNEFGEGAEIKFVGMTPQNTMQVVRVKDGTALWLLMREPVLMILKDENGGIP
jgi:hypothetical protein